MNIKRGVLHLGLKTMLQIRHSFVSKQAGDMRTKKEALLIADCFSSKKLGMIQGNTVSYLLLKV